MKHYKKLNNQCIEKFVSLDYTPEKEGVERISWFETEFGDCRQFDPAQLNLVMLNSPVMR